MLPPAYGFSPVPPGVQTFLSSGTWYKPPGVERVVAIVTAGGGGGGGGGGETGGTGGCGGSTKIEEVDVRGTTSETITVDTGGAGGAYGAGGTGGGASSFGALVSADGGVAGIQPATASPRIPGSDDYCSGYGGPAAGTGGPGYRGQGGT